MAATILTDTVARAVLRARVVCRELLAAGAVETSVAEASTIGAQSTVVAVVLASGLRFTTRTLPSRVTVASAVAARAVGATAQAARVLLLARLTREAWRAEALALGLIADTTRRLSLGATLARFRAVTGAN